MSLMIIGLALVLSGNAHIPALYMIGFGIIISLYLIISRARMNKTSKKLSVIGKAVIICWVYLPLSFGLAMSTNFFGEGIQGLSNWAMSSMLVGISALALTIIELYRTRKD